MFKSPDFWPPAPELRRREISLHFRGKDYQGYLIAPPASAGSRPLVLEIHNYAGLKFFDVHQAEYLARLGYVGLAIDVYGDMVKPEERLWSDDQAKLRTHLNRTFTAMVTLDHDHEFFRAILHAWLETGLNQPEVDRTVSAAAMGYCFGGVAVLEAVRGGLDLSAVVSFHGLLQTGEDGSPASVGVMRPPLKPCANIYNTRTIVQIENGSDDHLVQVDNRERFRKEMDDAGVPWVFHNYAKTPHGFALPATLGPPGHLHEASDRRSTIAMLNLLREVFPDVQQNSVVRNSAGTLIPL